MADLKIEPPAREPYEAPTVEDVPVRAEEQLLRGCKQPGGAGVGNPRPFGCSGGSGCVSPGAS